VSATPRSLANCDDSARCVGHYTATGQFVGSLPWAAPEQADASPAGIETRTDVYSLGVVLYQMLTGEFPYLVTGPMHEVVGRIIRDAPLAPRKLRRDIDEELETIVLQCLNKEPQRRYQTAGELGRDIEHYLRGEPLDAKRDSLPYLLRKSLRRHWLSASTAAAFVFVIAIGLAISLALWSAAAHDRDKAIEARRSEELARGQATDEAARATSVNEFLQTMLASADPDTGGGRELTVRAVLDDAARRIESPITAPRPQIEAALRMTIGLAYLSLTHFDAAERHLERARQLHEQLYGTTSEPYATSLQWLGILQRKRGDLAGAEKMQRDALALFRQSQLGNNTLAGYTLAELALVLKSQGRRDESIVLTREAIRTLRTALGPEHVDVIELESALAENLHDQSDAVDLARRAVAASRVAYGDAHPRVARSLRRLAGGLLARGERRAAQEHYEEALRLLRASFGDANQATLECVEDLVFLHSNSSAHEEALALSEEFLPAADATYGSPSAYRLYHLQLYSTVQRRAGDMVGCERTYREGIEASRIAPFSDPGPAVAFRQNLAELLLDRGACQEAAPLVEETQTMADERPGNFSPTTIGRIKCQRGEVLMCGGNFAEAEALVIEGVRQIRGTRLASEANRQRAARTIIRLYELWHAAEPEMGHALQAAKWRTELETASQPSPNSNSMP
jgi:tetratricopeptide (TPR) repeat protein